MKPHDAEQLALDLEDANRCMTLLGTAIAKKEAADEAVRSLRRQLREAVRRQKEAGWDLAAATACVKRTNTELFPPQPAPKKKGGRGEKRT